jgi:uncharacterized membrane protein
MSEFPSSNPYSAPVAPPFAPPLSFAARIRAYFFTGLVVAGPLAITAYITWWFISGVDNLIKPLLPDALLPAKLLPFDLPGVGLIVGGVGLILLGFITANLAGRYLVSWSEYLLGRMPVVSGLYKSVKQIFETVFSKSGSSFRKTGLIQYPQPNMWSLVFISTPPSGLLKEDLPIKDEMVSVFLPCSPNPTTGFFIYLPKKDVIEISLPVDDAAKLIMSAGLIQPDDFKKI